MTEKRWKYEQRRIARALNCTRIKNLGEPGPDMESEFLKVEARDRADLPQWLLTSLGKARGFASPHQLGLLVITSSSELQTLVVMDLRDYRDWYVDTLLKAFPFGPPEVEYEPEP
jgi:hypothetical protein